MLGNVRIVLLPPFVRTGAPRHPSQGGSPDDAEIDSGARLRESTSRIGRSLPHQARLLVELRQIASYFIIRGFGAGKRPPKAN
jgi:hypothetical protein